MGKVFNGFRMYDPYIRAGRPSETRNLEIAASIGRIEARRQTVSAHDST
jgi:hypothetical protein